MSKSSKKKSKRTKNRQRHGLQRQPQLNSDTTEPQPPNDEQLDATEHDGAITNDAIDTEALVAAENPDEVDPAVVTKSSAVQDLRAALLAKQKQQPKGWKQQVKAGKMVNAHVPKRFNRGG